MDTSAWHMQHFCKTLEMGGVDRHLAPGCGFQAGAFVCPAAPRAAGQNGKKQEKNGGNPQSHSPAPPVSTPPPAEHPSYRSSLTGIQRDNGTVPVLLAGAPLQRPTQALTGGQKCTLHLSAGPWGQIPEYLW